MKNIKNILGMGAFMLLSSWAVSSCTEKSDWDIDPSYSRPFGTDENGISVETDDRVARAVVSWSSTQNTDYYLIEVSPNEMTEDTPMGAEENESLVFGNDPANRITRSPFTMEGLAVNTTYYLRIKSISGEKESRWVNAKKTFESVKEETILNIPSVEDLPEGEGKVRMTWEAGLAVDYFEIVETGATEATTRDISATEAAAGEAWIENLKQFTEYTITIYNGNAMRGSRTVTIPGLEIESTITDITDNSAVFAWETSVNVDEYACILSKEGVPESGTKLSAEEIAAHKVTITGLNSSTEYTAYAFANGSICSRITFTTKKGKPTDYDVTMSLAEAESNWESLSGKVLITIDGDATFEKKTIPANVTRIMFWGEGTTKPKFTYGSEFNFGGQCEEIEFYNLNIISNANNILVNHNSNDGSADILKFTSCTLKNQRGIIRIRSNAKSTMDIQIDDCIIEDLGNYTASGSGIYGIIDTSGSKVLQTCSFSMTRTTFSPSTNEFATGPVIRFLETQTVDATIDQCTFYNCVSGQTLFRALNLTTLNISNVLFSGSGLKILNKSTEQPSVTRGSNVHVASDCNLSNTWKDLTINEIPMTTSQIFTNTGVDELNLVYGADIPDQYKVGDPRWNK